ncbi:glycine-rich domain-containing protein [Citrobacter portucalensis]|uniref:glycine-rich domain-containing protein n=1 Tax=Citrobacter portucalensis TaxID=1639133 RepID=UPI00211287CA|nr:hypothetical protein [Citrobacter portucalensis]MCQ6311668.1 hypothetical protein [Citrobacter portucalensis]
MAADVVVSSIKSFPDATSLALVSDLQFNEPYSSAALNRKFRGIVNTGFYGGFLPSPAGGLNLKISSGEEGGTASIDIDKYYQLTVRQQADVTLPVTAGKKVIVVLEATYALGQETYQVNCKSAVQAVEIKFLEEGTALRQTQLELCTVTVPAGATELTEEMIDVSRRRNQTVGITLSSEIDSDADHVAASSHAVKKAVKAARDETTKQIGNLVDGAPASLDTLKKIADAINNDPDFFNTLAEILKLKAPLESPELTGIPTVPTPPLSVSNKQVANTEYVQAAVAALVGSSPEALDTLAELAQALGNDPNFATTMLNALAGKQPLNETLTNLSGKDVAGLLQYLGLDVALSNKQPLSDTLTKLATLGPQTDADQVLFFSGKNVPAVTALTLAGRQFISKESVPDMLQYLTLGDGTGRLLGVQVFGNSGTYVKSPGVKKIIVEAVGGGGASGNLSATASNNCGISAAGSTGAYGKAFYYQNIPASVSVTVGGGGVGGAGPNGSGGDGGQTSFGSLLVCPGGKGSQQRQQVPPFSGGSTEEADRPTGAGLLFHSTPRSQQCAAFGLGSAMGIGLESTITTILGVYGTGGTGRYSQANSESTRGNDGYQGYVIVWEYQ